MNTYHLETNIDSKHYGRHGEIHIKYIERTTTMSQDKGLDVNLTVILVNEQGNVLWLNIMGDEWTLHCLQKTLHCSKGHTTRFSATSSKVVILLLKFLPTMTG